jgi:hypothetical protein
MFFVAQDHDIRTRAYFSVYHENGTRMTRRFRTRQEAEDRLARDFTNVPRCPHCGERL